MQIDNIKVYGLDESVIASGLPMRDEHDDSVFESQVLGLECNRDDLHYIRAIRLADTPIGSGHNNFLSGIVVQMNITATVKWWEQWQRYHFQQIISSMSTMHRLRKMLCNGTAKFNENTDPTMIATLTNMAKDSSVSDEKLAYSCPMGLELTARVSTNYLQLKTMYGQRKNHKLYEWRKFCDTIKILPHSELIGL